jgi:hypothetical protein
MIQQYPPRLPLPDDVLTLMQQTMDLVDLIYWDPTPTVGSPGEEIRKWKKEIRRQNDEQDQWAVDDTGFSQEVVEDSPTESSHSVQVHKKDFDWNNADLETRRAYGTPLLSGYGAFLALSSLPTSY